MEKNNAENTLMVKKYYVEVLVSEHCSTCGNYTHTKTGFKKTRTSYGEVYSFNSPREAWQSIYGCLNLDINYGVGKQTVIDTYGHNCTYKVIEE